MLSEAEPSRGVLERLKHELGEMVAAVRGPQASGDEGELREAATLFVSSYVFLQLWFAADLRYASKEHERWCMQVQSVHKMVYASPVGADAYAKS